MARTVYRTRRSHWHPNLGGRPKSETKVGLIWIICGQFLLRDICQHGNRIDDMFSLGNRDIQLVMDLIIWQMGNKNVTFQEKGKEQKKEGKKEHINLVHSGIRSSNRL